MKFDFVSPVPSVSVRTFFGHYRTYSSGEPHYAACYKRQEHPHLSDRDYHAMDEFSFDLVDFRQRFTLPQG